ncbi:acyltransferase [Burkholderia cenocepacia]|uniref:acyltransferase family protein n=1 Tax=Burkholderia cenocepacia TaxID=95486 RepID=UPI002AB0BADE|nr:acyltransferase [Burkholderia cenocepacia]
MTLDRSKQFFSFINGLRGIAASQVVVLHYGAAFLPALVRAGSPVHFDWEQPVSVSPLFLLAQGYTAVYVFFVMSGFVLGSAFIRSQASVPAEIAKRFVRLFLPVFTAVILGFALLRLAPLARTEAWTVSHSTWLAGLYQTPLNTHLVWSDALLHSLLLGYGPNSLFENASVLSPVIQLSQAIDPPLWTVHYEFWGSIILIGLSAFYKRFARWAAIAAILTAVAVAGTSFLCLFVLGFVLYLVHDRLFSVPRPLAEPAGIALLVTGIWLSVSSNQRVIADVFELSRKLPVMHAFDAFQFQWQISALCLFTGFLLSARLRRLGSGRAVQWLGKISFSLYLIHFPVLMTLGCWLFARLQSEGYLFASGASLILGFTASLLLATLVEKLVDRPSVALSRMCAEGNQRPYLDARS